MVDAIFIALISAGVITGLQGIMTMRGKRNAHVTFIERPLIDALAPKDQSQEMQALGRLRLVYGLFLIVVGVWALVTV
jgi:hypothetical protein